MGFTCPWHLWHLNCVSAGTAVRSEGAGDAWRCLDFDWPDSAHRASPAVTDAASGLSSVAPAHAVTKEESMTVLKLLADAFHEGGWGMWPILFLLMLTIAIVIERAVYLRKAVIDKEKLLGLLRSQISAGNIQGAIKVCSGNSTPVTRILAGGPDARQPLGRRDRGGHGRGQPARAARHREAHRLPGHAGQPGHAGRSARHHRRSHQVVRRRRRCRSVAEGDPAVEGHLRGHELHVLRPAHRHHRPRRPTPG